MPTSVVQAVCKRHANCGCKEATCCFECPLPDCRYGSLPKQKRPQTEARDKQIRDMRDQGRNSTEISQRLDVSLRTVWRALQDAH